MKRTVLLACAGASLLVAVGSMSASASPLSLGKSDIGWSKSIQKADWNDRPYWRRRHHRRYWDGDGWRGRGWWHRRHGWYGDNWRRHRDRGGRGDWDDRGRGYRD